MPLILVIILVVLVIALIPSWPYSREWGYFPGGGAVALLLIVLLLWLLGVF